MNDNCKLRSISDLSLRAILSIFFLEQSNPRSKIRVIFYDEVSIVDSMRLGHGINFFYGTGEDFLEQVLRLYTSAKFFLIKPRGIVCARAYTERSL